MSRWLACLLVACAPLVASSCGHDCSSVGCPLELSVSLPPGALSPDMPQTFRVCVDASCTNGTLMPMTGATICQTEAWGFCIAVPASVGIRVSGVPGLNDSGRLHAVSFQLSTNGMLVASASQSITFGHREINGPGCGECIVGQPVDAH
jgi:hypothetical protein